MDIIEKINRVLNEGTRLPKVGDRVKVLGIYGRADRFGVVVSTKNMGRGLHPDEETVGVQIEGDHKDDISFFKLALIEKIGKSEDLEEDRDEENKFTILLNQLNQNKILKIIDKYIIDDYLTINLIEGIFSDYADSRISEKILVDTIKEEAEYADVKEEDIEAIIKDIKLFIFNQQNI